MITINSMLLNFKSGVNGSNSSKGLADFNRDTGLESFFQDQNEGSNCVLNQAHCAANLGGFANGIN